MQSYEENVRIKDKEFLLNKLDINFIESYFRIKWERNLLPTLHEDQQCHVADDITINTFYTFIDA